MSYQVHLENFEGPLDLLLYFIQRDKIDIYDIPIALIADEYLGYLHVMERLNISVAGEFILLAATLMRIKARMLLPRPEAIEDELIDDPRKELVQQLLEYQRFKEASEKLGDLVELRKMLYTAGKIQNDSIPGIHPGDYLQNVTLYKLMAVFKEVMDRMPSSDPMILVAEPIKLEDQIRFINKAFGVKREISFRDLLLHSNSVHEVVMTLLALLEMMRRGAITVKQDQPYEEIMIIKNLEN